MGIMRRQEDRAMREGKPTDVSDEEFREFEKCADRDGLGQVRDDWWPWFLFWWNGYLYGRKRG